MNAIQNVPVEQDPLCSNRDGLWCLEVLAELNTRTLINVDIAQIEESVHA